MSPASIISGKVRLFSFCLVINIIIDALSMSIKFTSILAE